MKTANYNSFSYHRETPALSFPRILNNPSIITDLGDHYRLHIIHMGFIKKNNYCMLCFVIHDQETCLAVFIEWGMAEFHITSSIFNILAFNSRDFLISAMAISGNIEFGCRNHFFIVYEFMNSFCTTVCHIFFSYWETSKNMQGLIGLTRKSL